MNRAYLTLGPESSGTRLMTRLLIAAGCYGDGDHDQRLDDGLPLDEPFIVWRRSLPHRGQWPLIASMIELLSQRDYEITAVVMSRDWHSMILSQQAAPHVETVEEAMRNIRMAYRLVFAALGNLPYEMVNYESLVIRPLDTFFHLAQRLGLPSAEAPGIYIHDGNEKHYRGCKLVERN